MKTRCLPVLLLAALCSPAAGQAVDAFWISVIDEGAYRVTYESLVAVGDPGTVDSSLLALTNHGVGVPIWIEDGGDGVFGPGDAFEFVGEHLASEISYFNEYSKHNAYRLTLDSPGGRRMTVGTRTPEPGLPDAPLAVRKHLEKDTVMVRFSQRPDTPDTETWFWRRLSFLDQEPFVSKLELHGLAQGPGRLRVQARGWSSHRMPVESPVPQHRIEVAVNETPVAAGDWDGQDFVVVEGDIEPGLLGPGINQITVAVPPRKVEEEEDPIIDLSLLNWIEIDYPHTGTVEEPQVLLNAAGEGRRVAHLRAPGSQSLVTYDDRARRWVRPHRNSDEESLTVELDGPEATLLAVRDGSFRSPAGIAVDRPSAWRQPGNSADYLMIAHSSLLEGAERLAAYHRSRGLEVALIDVQDAYDEFNHGVAHPRALRELIAYAHREWAQPAPRFVLLVGDSSWDVEREGSTDEDYSDWSYQAREGTAAGFLKNSSTPYATGPDNRALIPTGSYRGAEGHAASDNYFVALEEGEYKPALAIGRLPVVEPAELDAIVDKTIRYIEESGVGPWRRKLLWISNEAEYIQRSTDALAAEQLARGFAADKVYPLKSEASNEQHQQRLLEAFAEGQLVVHFHGHGGRYIWRTGPTDYKKNRDLFNLDHLDLLEPSPRLPIVLSMTCFSAPFDHPLADSIGEKFLRLPDRGAIAVLAASWRNSPATAFSRALVDHLTRPGTIGEAILAAKRDGARRDMVETYNLLGDPAVPIAAPQRELEVEVSSASTGELRLSARLGADAEAFEGRALIEWLDGDGTALTTEEVAVRGSSIEAVFDHATLAPEAVSVYMWDAERGIDGLGVLDWAPDEETQAHSETPAGPASR